MKTLAYHNILPQAGEHIPVAHLQVTLADFRRQMQRLRERLLHPQDVEDQILRRQSFPKGFLITFDDGAEGIIEAGKVLAEIGAVGVAFICPGAVQEGLWFYRLANALTQTGQETISISGASIPLSGNEARLQAYHHLSKPLFDMPPMQRDEHLQQIVAQLQMGDRPVHRQLRILDEAGLQVAADTGGILFANHSWSHPNLTVLDNEALGEELTKAEDWLQTSGLPTVNWFAYPRGCQNKRVREAVRQRFKLAFDFQDGQPLLDILDLIPRIGIYAPDQNLVRFQLKLNGAGRWANRLRKLRGLAN